MTDDWFWDKKKDDKTVSKIMTPGSDLSADYWWKRMLMKDVPKKLITFPDGRGWTSRKEGEGNIKIVVHAPVERPRVPKEAKETVVTPEKFPVPIIEVFSLAEVLGGTKPTPLGFLIDCTLFKDEDGDPYSSFSMYVKPDKDGNPNTGDISASSSYRIEGNIENDVLARMLTQVRELEEWGDGWNISHEHNDGTPSHSNTSFAPGYYGGTSYLFMDPLVVDWPPHGTNIYGTCQKVWDAGYSAPSQTPDDQAQTWTEVDTMSYLVRIYDLATNVDYLNSSYTINVPSEWEWHQIYCTGVYGEEWWNYSGENIDLMREYGDGNGIYLPPDTWYYQSFMLSVNNRTTPDPGIYAYLFTREDETGRVADYRGMYWLDTVDPFGQPIGDGIDNANKYVQYRMFIDDTIPDTVWMINAGGQTFEIYTAAGGHVTTTDPDGNANASIDKPGSRAMDLEIYKYPLYAQGPDPVYVFSVRRETTPPPEFTDFFEIMYGFIWSGKLYKTDWFPVIDMEDVATNTMTKHSIPSTALSNTMARLGVTDPIGMAYIRAGQVESSTLRTSG